MVKIGLVGVGYLGTRHLHHLKNLEGVEVPAVWDLDPDALLRARAEFGVPAARSLTDLIAKSDAVDVVTPTTTHLEVGMKVIQAGKPLMVEKPLCATAAEGRLLVEAAAGSKVPVQVGHVERFNRAWRALSTLRIRPMFIEGHRLATFTHRGLDVAVVFDLMIHDLDLVLTLIDEEPARIYASGVGVVTDSVDIANARLEFPGGAVANLTASRVSLKRMRKLRLFGPREYVALDFAKGTCEYVGGTPHPPPEEDAEPLGTIQHGSRTLTLYRRFPEAPEGDALALELAAFREVAARGAKPPVSAEEGLRALTLAERILQVIHDSTPRRGSAHGE